MDGNRKLKDWLTAYLEYQQRFSEAPTIFQKWCGISTIAAVLQRKVCLNWEAPIYPNMYVVLVGPAAARKGTAMRVGRDMLLKLDVPLSADSITREALIHTMKNMQQTFPDEKAGKSIIHSSITIYSPELAVFIGFNNPALISALTDWFDCQDPWIYKTRGHGEERIEKTWVNLIGATTPDILQSILPQDAIGGGLTSRIIFVYANRPSRIVVFPQLSKAEIKLGELLVEDLFRILDMVGEFDMNDDYMRLYEDWYVETSKNPPFKDERFEAYTGRRALHLKKLSMIMCASRSSDRLLEAIDFKRAKDTLLEVEAQMSNVYASYGRVDYAKYIKRIETVIAVEKEILLADLYRQFMRDLEQEELMKILSALASIKPPFCELRKDIVDKKVIVTVVYCGGQERKVTEA